MNKLHFIPLFLVSSQGTETPSNVDFFQKSISLAEMNPDQGNSEAGFKKNIFKLTYNNNNAAFGFLIPDALYGSFIPESETSNQTIATYSYSSAEYQASLSYESEFDLDLSLDGIVMNWFDIAVKVSKDYQYAVDIFASHEAALVVSRAKTKTWSATLSKYMAPDEMNLIQLDEEFNYVVSKLPVEYIVDDYINFIKEYGTHFIASLVMGAKYSCRTFFENVTLNKMKSEGMNIDITASEETWFQGASKSANVEKSSTLKKYEENAIGIESCSGHGPLPPSIDPHLWNEVAKKDSYPLQMKLAPLTNILTPSYFPNDPNIHTKAVNFLQACTEFCSETQECYNPDPKPSPLWEEEHTVSNGARKKLMAVSKGLCILTQVYKTTFQSCKLFISNLEPGDVNYYWYIQASTSNIECSARCSSYVTWPKTSQSSNELVPSLSRYYQLGHPYTYRGTYTKTLESLDTSFCFLTYIHNQVACSDYGKTYLNKDTWVIDYYTDNPWNSNHQDLNSVDRDYGAICLNITSAPKLLYHNSVNADQGIVPLILVEEGICIFETITGTGECGIAGKGGGVRLRQQEVAGRAGTWWAFEGYVTPAGDPYRCVGAAEIKCYTY